MSASSGTTLISPNGTGAAARTTGSTNPHPPRRSNSHSAHHRPQRRASLHHNHHSGHHSGHHAGFSRRPSEGDHGRRAMTAGLAMQVLAAANGDKPKRSKSRERPLAKSSRSDTHLPRLSRTTSITSDASHSSNANQKKRPTKPRKRSGESVQVLSEDGQTSSKPGDSEEEEDGWEESGDEEEDEEQRPADPKASTNMRRTVSDTQAEVPAKAGDAKATVESPADLDHPPPLTQRTTGFAGAIHTPAPDPFLEAQTMKNVSTPHYNDPMHVMPAHQIKHQQSSRSIRITGSTTELSASPNPISVIDGEKTPRPGSIQRVGSGQMAQPAQQDRPTPPDKKRSTDGSGLAKDEGVKTSPAFPFPKMITEPSQLPSPPPTADTATTQPQPRSRASEPPAQSSDRRRMPSGAEPRLRHRYSNSSIRSVQSLRAPPHPLNSPTGGLRSGLPTTATSRPGSMFNSPQKGERRGPNMHHPPIAPPIVYREIVSGEGYAIPEDAPAMVKPTPKADRQASFSSQQNLLGIMSSTRPVRDVASTLPSISNTHPRNPSRRRTAMEAAAAAARMPTTNDPVEYHHSLGYPATSAETAHLISRFLPLKKDRVMDWEITTENMDNHSGLGLARGPYRDAHESLIRMMKDASISAPSRRTATRSASYQTLAGPDDGIQQVGTLKGRNGPLAVSKGGWQGKTPFELSVERCIAQRPQRTGGL